MTLPPPPAEDAALRPGLFDREPFLLTSGFARTHGCDLAMAGNIGLGSLVCFTPIAESMARRIGRPLRLLTAPFRHYDNAVLAPETPYPVWANNPFIAEIVDADTIDPHIDRELCREAHNFCQAGHIVENMLAAYGLRPRRNRGSLYLTTAEQHWALEQLAHLPRPLVCLNPHSHSASPPGTPWFEQRWHALIDRLHGWAGYFLIGFDEDGKRNLPGFRPPTTIRQMMALIWAADAYVGFDGGPSHVAAALDTPSVVLWDAVRKVALEEDKHPGFATAMINRWAYPENCNLMLLGEQRTEILDRVVRFLRRTLDQAP
jgi:Glycosyltransferase family 9 (heptosyltransferase)